MKLMHTKLPEFIQRLQDAAVRHTPEMKMEIKGMENVHSAKLQSLRTGRIANAVEEIACTCLLYTSPSPRDRQKSRMPSSA